MKKEILNLRQADGIEIITLVDNFSDVLLPNSEAVFRPPIATGGMIPKIECASESLEKGVGKVHILNGKKRHALLLELFTDKGIGTEIKT